MYESVCEYTSSALCARLEVCVSVDICVLTFTARHEDKRQKKRGGGGTEWLESCSVIASTHSHVLWPEPGVSDDGLLKNANNNPFHPVSYTRWILLELLVRDNNAQKWSCKLRRSVPIVSWSTLA